ncbi:KGGVGR-motif variant AAA ATPase [Corallococcus interemptor]|uniref:KGGVGR-motif variant AAA ATPase n=1 Tax=Corallococcus interemptor TaxID=2316720 RepID=UPI003D063F85
MHTVTFYSFKGGVGRTMALVNVAASLAAKGRRVLVVDFDLEAPGVSTYGLFKGRGDLGVVDFVEHYRQHGEAPDVREYVRRCDVSVDTGELWLMPAGRQDPLYGSRLNSIDWLKLYSEEDGYLLFEDLKAQWKESINPDYVLIDSRTGHTDVGGICTRQLPDSVVALFVPTEQNLIGLRPVVESIRREANPPRSRVIHLHFVPSNVPELDDEEGIVFSALEHARATLGYDQPAAILHHYGSLSLLNQPIFIHERPRTRLAKEYAELASAIARQNINDRDGVLSYLHLIEKEIELGATSRTAGRLEERLDEVASAHSRDGEVLAHMASIQDIMGNSEGVLSLLTIAIESGYRKASIYNRRARVLRSMGRVDDAIADFRAALESEDADFQDIYFAIRTLVELSPHSLASIASSRTLRRLSIPESVILSEAMSTPTLLPVAERLLRDINEDSSLGPAKHMALRQLAIVHIGQGRFEEAMSLMAASRGDITSSEDISQVFNYAMAEWGVEGRPPIDLFKRTLDLDLLRQRGGGVNYSQCLAIAAHFAGDATTAKERLARARQGIAQNPVSTFSCWRYLEVPPSEFEEDLDDIDQLLRGANVVPKFIFARAN